MASVWYWRVRAKAKRVITHKIARLIQSSMPAQRIPAITFTTLATAEWVASVIWQRRWGWMPLAAFWTWLSVDSVYWAYWSVVRPEAMIREGQWLASLCLYALCGIIWYRVVPMAAELIERR
jgi:hypothetical protein